MKYRINFLGRYKRTAQPFEPRTTVIKSSSIEDARTFMANHGTFDVSGEMRVTTCEPQIGVSSIEITSGEGRAEWYPKTVHSWTHFESWSNGIRARILSDYKGKWSGGYYKMDFVVTFEDGEIYKGRYDLSEKSEFLDQHIWRHCTFHAGVWCPPHLTIENYLHYLEETRKYSKEPNVYLDFLARYDV